MSLLSNKVSAMYKNYQNPKNRKKTILLHSGGKTDTYFQINRNIQVNFKFFFWGNCIILNNEKKRIEPQTNYIVWSVKKCNYHEQMFGCKKIYCSHVICSFFSTFTNVPIESLAEYQITPMLNILMGLNCQWHYQNTIGI